MGNIKFIIVLIVLILLGLFYVNIANAQIVFYESVGNVGGTTPIATHESANGFDNDSYTMTGTGDVRITTPSTGYAGASGLANIFLTNVVGRDFVISDINTSTCAGMYMSFGVQKSSAGGFDGSLIVEVSTDGVSYSPLTFTYPGAGTGWFLVNNTSGVIPSTSNLRIRFRQNGISSQYRIDDITLHGTCSCTTPTIVTGAMATPGNTIATINWGIPSCFDEFLIVTNTTPGCDFTPTGDGSSYTANPVYASNNQVVYKGSGTSANVSNLMNGTTYYFEIFTRKGTNWTSCVEVSAMPSNPPCLEESFTNATYPPTGWTQTTTSRSTTVADYVTGPAAAIFGSNNGLLTTSAVAFPNQLKFFLGRSNNATDKTLNIRVSTTSQVSGFNTIAVFDHSNVPVSSYNEYTINLASYSSFPVVYIQFEKISATTSPWRLDDVRVQCGTIPSSNMNLSANSNAIVSGDVTPSTSDNTDFGSNYIGNQILKTYTINNTGSANLNISAITLTGANASDFVVTTAPASVVAPGSSTTFTVRFLPSSAGLKSATLNIFSNDLIDYPYYFSIQGMSMTAPNYDLTVVPFVQADSLYLSLYATRKNATLFDFGTSNFVLNLDTNIVAPIKSPVAPYRAADGVWDNGNLPASYQDMQLGPTIANTFANLSVVQLPAGTNPTGTTLPNINDPVLIGTIRLKIKDCNATYAPTWRTGVGSGQIQDYNGNLIKTFANFINPTAIPLGPNLNVSLTATDTTICAGETVTFSVPNTAGITNYNFLRNGTSVQSGMGLTYFTNTIVNGDVFRVVLTNTQGCTDTTSSVTMIVNPTPVASITETGSNPFCVGDSLLLTASPSGGGETYLWSTGATTQSIYVFGGGNYSVIVTVAGGCSDTASTNVVVNVAPSNDIVLDWAGRAGNAGADIGFSTAIDDDGNVYVTGYFNGTVDFDLGAGIANLISTTNSIFIAKYNSLGSYIWAKNITATVGCDARSITIDKNSNVYITGSLYGTADFDPGAGVANLASAGVQDIYFAKYDANGNYVWAKRVGAAAEDISFSISTDVYGNVLITGRFSNTVDFDPNAGVSNLVSAGSQDIFLAKYNANGNYIWAHSFGTAGTDQGNDLTVDGFGNIYFTGSFQGTVDFDPSVGVANLVSAGSTDIFFAKYSPNGNYMWAKNVGGTSGDAGNGIELDDNGYIYITGHFDGTADFDPDAGISNLVTAGSADIFFAKYTSNGNYIWAKRIGQGSPDISNALAIDGSGNVYITGYFNGTADFDPGAGVANLISIGVQDIFLGKYDTNGNYVWAKKLGGTGNDVGNSISLNKNGQILLTGYFNGTVDFDPSTGIYNLASGGGNDIFIAKYESGVFITPSTDTTICQGQSVLFTANNLSSASYDFQWYQDNSTVGSNINNHTATLAGGYSVLVTDNVSGCSTVSDTVNLTVNPTPVASITETGSNPFCVGDSLQLTANPSGGGETYLWNTASTNQSIYATGGGNYSVIVANTFGCTDTAYTNVGANVAPSNDVIFSWAYAASGGAAEIGRATAVDKNGNIYVTGQFVGTVDFDPSAGVANLVSVGVDDIFFAKYDKNGNYVWAKNIGSTTADIAYGIALDAIGNVYITGGFQGTADFDPSAGVVNLVSVGSNDIFLAKYDMNGNFIWANRMGSTGSDIGYGIALDGIGNVHIIGQFLFTVDFDPSVGVVNLVSAGSNEVFFAKYDMNGNFIWAKRVGGTNIDIGYAIAVDGIGNVHITGLFNGTADFDPSAGIANLVSAGGSDFFFAKYDANGNYLWANRIGSTGADVSNTIALDGSGNVHLAGYFNVTVDFDPSAGIANLGSAGGLDIFYAKYDANGNYIWANRIGSTGSDLANGLVIDVSGNVYITGYFQVIADFDPGAETVNLTSFGNLDVFFAKYNANGNYVWAKNVGSTGADIGYGIALNKKGDVHLTGYFNGTADFDPSSGIFNLVSAGGNDIFIAKYENGVFLTPTTDTTICDGQSVLFTANNLSSASYNFQWYQDNTTVGSNINNHTSTLAGGYSVLVTDNVSGCSTISDTVNVTVNPLPTVDAGTDQAVCNNVVINLVATSANATSTSWQTTGTGVLTTPTLLSTTYNQHLTDEYISPLKMKIIATNLCGSIADSILVTINDCRPKAKVAVGLQGRSTPTTGIAGYLDPYSVSGAGQSPYRTDPPIKMVVGTIPANAIDVVKIELWANTSTKSDSTYAWLLSDNTLLDFESGTRDYVNFKNATPGNYFVVIKHRNHLTIQSTNQVTINTTSPAGAHDPANGNFSFLSIGNIFGGGAILDGVAKMIGGNARAYQEINADDLYDVRIASDNLLPGYLVTDVDLSGGGNTLDFNITSFNNDNLMFSTADGNIAIDY